MNLGINGRVAVITGGDSGIGFATAELLLRQGARRVLTDKEDALCKRLRRSFGPSAWCSLLPPT